ncbi:MAG: hypothetical protein PHS53_04120 [Candidatus Pacebacteria bacterium]|nr:hypothetical protein [Candidatus Paceibacterota bacterium]
MSFSNKKIEDARTEQQKILDSLKGSSNAPVDMKVQAQVLQSLSAPTSEKNTPTPLTAAQKKAILDSLTK